MDPNTNQPGQAGAAGQPNSPAGQQPEQPQADWPPETAPVPDWQQGLGTSGATPPAAGQPAPGTDAGLTPGATPAAGSQPPTPNTASVYPTPTAGVVAPMSGAAGGMGGNMGGNRSKLMMILVGAVVALALIIGGVYWWTSRQNASDAKKAANSSSSSAAKNAVDMATIKTLTLGAPTDLSSYKEDSSPQKSYHVYLTQQSTDAKACSLEFGVVSATDLPGADLDHIVDPQVESLKKAGASVDGPHAGSPLILKDAKNKSVTYRMPTLNYEFSKDNKHVTVHYSLVILKDNTRAVVSRQCANTDGVADATELAKVEKSAQQITVSKQ